MKPRSAVARLLAVTETLIAARAKAAQTRQTSQSHAPRATKVVKVVDTRPLLLRIWAQAFS
jgi:hypothetical protein